MDKEDLVRSANQSTSLYSIVLGCDLTTATNCKIWGPALPANKLSRMVRFRLLGSPVLHRLGLSAIRRRRTVSFRVQDYQSINCPVPYRVQGCKPISGPVPYRVWFRIVSQSAVPYHIFYDSGLSANLLSCTILFRVQGCQPINCLVLYHLGSWVAVSKLDVAPEPS